MVKRYGKSSWPVRQFPPPPKCAVPHHSLLGLGERRSSLTLVDPPNGLRTDGGARASRELRRRRRAGRARRKRSVACILREEPRHRQRYAVGVVTDRDTPR